MGDDLETRLKAHNKAFEGLLSLIPAKEYYGKDESVTSTQWQKRTKQTTAERQAAKRAKLDPASHKSAQDVLEENARKRKREREGHESPDVDVDMDIEKEKPLEGMKTASTAKKQKQIPADATADEQEGSGHNDVESSRAKARADKKKQKLEKKKERLAQKQQKQQERKEQKQEFNKALNIPKEPQANEDDDEEEGEEDDEAEGVAEHPDDRIQLLDVSGLVEEGQDTATPSDARSNPSTASEVSAASSSTSMIPDSTEPVPQRKDKKSLKLDQKKHDVFRARLNAKLEAMRAARKADGPDGRPARNRAELIEARRKKEAERKAARKASRQLAKEDQERLKAEEELARIRGGSGSPSLFAPRSPENERNFNFGKVAWQDGQQLEGNLSGFLESKKKKGRSDPKTALEAAEKKKARINGLDEAKRKQIEEQDLWLAAKKRAQGEKVHDDPSLLKKSLKRQQKAKEKSKQEWKNRLTSVQENKAAKQKKREENLKKRKEEKGSKGNKVKKPSKKVKRPGFEGTFKAR